jgi:hypothetical protein
VEPGTGEVETRPETGLGLGHPFQMTDGVTVKPPFPPGFPAADWGGRDVDQLSQLLTGHALQTVVWIPHEHTDQGVSVIGDPALPFLMEERDAGDPTMLGGRNDES